MKNDLSGVVVTLISPGFYSTADRYAPRAFVKTVICANTLNEVAHLIRHLLPGTIVELELDTGCDWKAPIRWNYIVPLELHRPV